MHRSPYDPRDWKELVPDIEEILQQMDGTPIISLGITAFTRIIPSFFLRKYSVYVTRKSSDTDVMRESIKIDVLEDRDPKLAKKVHSTGYLINSYAFQNFLRSRREKPKLMLTTVTTHTTEALEKLGIEWLGNAPHTFESVMLKGRFRELVRERGLPSLESTILTRTEFLAASFESLYADHGGSFVVQRADKEVGGNDGTFFIHALSDFEHCVAVLSTDESFEEVVCTPFIKGQSVSMLGCVLAEGTLSGPLQLQLIDVPESLHGVPPSGIFFGNDIGFTEWSDQAEKQAQEIVESIGVHLASEGYRGIFGIDFLYDETRKQIYPNECNPRFTGSVVLHSLMMLQIGVPPLEFFHLMAHLGIPATFDLEAVSAALKQRIPCAHIAISPKGITSMEMPLLAGIYEFDASGPSLSYKGPGLTLADIKNERQFLLIDTVPAVGSSIEQEVPRLFKFIFPKSIARSSYEIDPEAGFLLDRFSTSLIAACNASGNNSQTPS